MAPGCVGSAQVRPDGTVEYTCSSAAEPTSVRALHPDGTDRVLVALPGERAPGSVPVEDLWTAGDVHALVARARRRPPAHGVQPARRPARRRRGPLQPGPRHLGRRGLHRGRGQLPRLDGLRLGLARRDRGPPRAHRAGGRRRGGRPLRRRGHRRPGALRRRGLVVGRLPRAAGGGHAAGAVGGGHRGRAGGRLPHRLRRRDGAAAGVRPGAVRGLAGGEAGASAGPRRRSPTSTPSARRCSCWPGRTTRAARSGRSTTTSTRWPPAAPTTR